MQPFDSMSILCTVDRKRDLLSFTDGRNIFPVDVLGSEDTHSLHREVLFRYLGGLMLLGSASRRYNLGRTYVRWPDSSSDQVLVLFSKAGKVRRRPEECEISDKNVRLNTVGRITCYCLVSWQGGAHSAMINQSSDVATTSIGLLRYCDTIYFVSRTCSIHEQICGSIVSKK
jgi:hypothetical protein